MAQANLTPNKQFPGLVGLGKVTVPWGGKTNYEKFHPGIDIANVKGTPVKAPVSGVVVDAVRGKQQGDAAYGNSVRIKDANGNSHNLGHLDQTQVQKGQTINSGMQIGTMGNSGSAYSPSGKGDGTHLDYRIVSAFGRYRNPQPYLNNLS